MIFPKSRDEWLDLRLEHVSSTESSALFGLSPYTTAFELAVMKKTRDRTEYMQSERMQWGTRLQRAIAEGIGEDYGVKVRSVSGYASKAPEVQIGASFDFEIVGIGAIAGFPGDKILQQMWEKHGPGVLEIKNVDAWIFKQQWSETNEQVEAPAHIELQVQHQLECIEHEWAAIGVLVGGNRQVLITRMRDRDVGKAIRAKTQRFYELLGKGEMPPVTLPQDSDTIRKLYGYAEPDSLKDHQGAADDADLHKLARDHAEAIQLKSAAEKHAKSTSAALLMAIGTTEKVLFDDMTVSASMVAPSHIEAYDRAGYRNLRVYPRKPKEPKK
jgi:predicted phage-related endonuclease